MKPSDVRVAVPNENDLAAPVSELIAVEVSVAVA